MKTSWRAFKNITWLQTQCPSCLNTFLNPDWRLQHLNRLCVCTIPASHSVLWSLLEVHAAAFSDLHSGGKFRSSYCCCHVNREFCIKWCNPGQTQSVKFVVWESSLTWGSCFIWATSFCRGRTRQKRISDTYRLKMRTACRRTHFRQDKESFQDQKIHK